ncbi:MAG: aminotransferase class I/II-fold pyridoxal phosphate-dependent enzyme, partial [Planctomycetes bacterium]|nr:aminotransferase class I/II-fold pyridoxal phosphate-dependent enzyme [Planctomycetota bacterium]
MRDLHSDRTRVGFRRVPTLFAQVHGLIEELADLEEQLKQAQGARSRIIVTDGVFSMDGFIAKVDEICDLAQKYDAIVMVDDSHATG